MSLLNELRGRARSWLESRVRGTPPASAHPAEPGSPELGALAFEPGDAPVPMPIPTEWAGVGDRAAHRHAWFAVMAQHDPMAAQAALESWLRHDLPGRGAAWAHPSDLAERMVNWHAGLSWLGLRARPELRAAMAGSAAWHLRHLHNTMPSGPHDGHRRVAHHAGALVAGLTFPGIEGARAAWSEAASGLGREWPALVFADGADRAGVPLFLLRSAWLTAAAQAVAHANGTTLPGAARASWTQAAWFLSRLAAGVGSLPPLGAIPDSHADWPVAYPLAWSLWNLAGEDEPLGGRDPLATWFSARVNGTGGLVRSVRTHAPRGSTSETRPAWAMSSFASDGWAVATGTIRGEPARVVVHAASACEGPLHGTAPLSVRLDVGGIGIVTGDNALEIDGAKRGRAQLDVSRVDNKKARIEGHSPAARRAWHRDVLLNQARLIVTDRVVGGGDVRLSFTIPGGWTREGEGNELTLRHPRPSGPLVAVLQLSPVLAWRRNGNAFVGTGKVRDGENFGFDIEIR